MPLTEANQGGNRDLLPSDDGDSWEEFIRVFRSPALPLPSPWSELFGPLRAGTVDDLTVIGQIGQSLDGRIATASGHSHYINGPAGITHLHRLRSLVDAVVVGDRKSTRLNSSHIQKSRMPSSD